MNWEAITAACAVATVISAMFGMFFRLAVKDEIRKQTDALTTTFQGSLNRELDLSMNLLRERLNTIQKQLDGVDKYAHDNLHLIREEWMEAVSRAYLAELKKEG